VKKYLQLLDSKYLLSLPTFITTLIFSLLTHLVDTAHNVKGHILTRSIAIILVHIVIFAFMRVSLLPLGKVGSKGRYQGVTLLVIGLAAALRGLLVYGALTALGIEGKYGILFRLHASFTNIGLALVVATFSVAFISEHSASTNAMLRDQQRLIALRNEAIEQLAQFDGKLKESIASTLARSISNLTTVGSDEALQMLRVSIDKVIRPLSNYLDQQAKTILNNDKSEVQYKISWKSVFDRSAHSNEISPAAILLSLVIFGGAALSNDMSLSKAGLEVSSVLILGALLLRLSKRFFNKFERASKRTRFISLLLALYIPGQILGFESVLVLSGTSKPRQFLFLIPVFSVLLGWLFAVLRSARNEAVHVRNQMDKVAAELRWELARARELNRQQQRLLTFTIHGQIQAAMEASFLKLQNAINTQSDTIELREDLVNLIEESVGLLYRNYQEPEEISSVLFKIRDTWQGLATINWKISEELKARIEKDPICQLALTDLVTELVFNAVKHGRPGEISIEVSLQDTQIIELSVTNPGDVEANSDGSGLGTKLLEESAISWERIRNGDRVKTVALLPVLT